MKKERLGSHNWEAEKYHVHSTAQKSAANLLLQSMQLEGREHVLDVGCGDGKITAQIAKSLTTGTVLGIDTSQKMVEFAEKTFPRNKFPNLFFLTQDARSFRYNEKFDTVFSSFALQWLDNPDAFFKCAFESLNSAGYIAATIPLGVSSELEIAISTTISLPEWSKYFHGFSTDWHFLSAEQYHRLLDKHHFVPTLFNVVHQLETYPSRQDFEEYVIQWFSYMRPLPQHLKQIFFKQVIDTYLAFIPSYNNREVCFKFLRLDFIAKKNYSLIKK